MLNILTTIIRLYTCLGVCLLKNRQLNAIKTPILQQCVDAVVATVTVITVTAVDAVTTVTAVAAVTAVCTVAAQHTVCAVFTAFKAV